MPPFNRSLTHDLLPFVRPVPSVLLLISSLNFRPFVTPILPLPVPLRPADSVHLSPSALSCSISMAAQSPNAIINRPSPFSCPPSLLLSHFPPQVLLLPAYHGRPTPHPARNPPSRDQCPPRACVRHHAPAKRTATRACILCRRTAAILRAGFSASLPWPSWRSSPQRPPWRSARARPAMSPSVVFDRALIFTVDFVASAAAASAFSALPSAQQLLMRTRCENSPWWPSELGHLEVRLVARS